MKELLLLLCRYPCDPANGDRLKELLSLVEDWEKTVNLINEHGIIALAAYNIKEAGLAGLVPELPMRKLEDGLRQNIVRNAWLTLRWKEVNRILSEAGIKHLLLKGMALEYTVYGGKGLRQMNDCDILVNKEQAMKAWILLQENGFKPEMMKSSLHRKIIMDIGKHLPELSKDGYTVEIHHRLFKEIEANKALPDAIENAARIMIEGIPGYIPEKKIHLSFLKEHLLQHLAAGEAQLRLYTDMELIEPGSAPQIPDWFIENPKLPADPEHRKNFYRDEFYLLPYKYRFRYLAGDFFPSLMWIKKRHNCGTMKAIGYYPRRIGKILWLAG